MAADTKSVYRHFICRDKNIMIRIAMECEIGNMEENYK